MRRVLQKTFRSIERGEESIRSKGHKWAKRHTEGLLVTFTCRYGENLALLGPGGAQCWTGEVIEFV